MKFEQFPTNENNDDYYKNRKLSERVDGYSMTQPTHKLEAGFLRMEADKDIPESNEQEIIDKVVQKHKDKKSMNAVSFFNYKGAVIKIGEIKTLSKFLYEITLDEKRHDGWHSHSEVEENVKQIIQEAEKMIEAQERK